MVPGSRLFRKPATRFTSRPDMAREMAGPIGSPTAWLDGLFALQDYVHAGTSVNMSIAVQQILQPSLRQGVREPRTPDLREGWLGTLHCRHIVVQ